MFQRANGGRCRGQPAGARRRDCPQCQRPQRVGAEPRPRLPRESVPVPARRTSRATFARPANAASMTPCSCGAQAGEAEAGGVLAAHQIPVPAVLAEAQQDGKIGDAGAVLGDGERLVAGVRSVGSGTVRGPVDRYADPGGAGAAARTFFRHCPCGRRESRQSLRSWRRSPRRRRGKPFRGPPDEIARKRRPRPPDAARRVHAVRDGRSATRTGRERNCRCRDRNGRGFVLTVGTGLGYPG